MFSIFALLPAFVIHVLPVFADLPVLPGLSLRPPSRILAFLTPNTDLYNQTPSTNATNLNAAPPPNFYIDGRSEILPHPYRITFEEYGSPITNVTSAYQCLEDAAIEFFRHHNESELMGRRQRLYASGDLVIGIKPGENLTWGYWGAAIRAINSMWKAWDIIELEFVIGVETEGVLGWGFLTSTIGPSLDENHDE